MNVLDMGMLALFLQIPLTFWAVLKGAPAAQVLMAWMTNEHSTRAVVVSVPLQLPCMLVSVLIAYTGAQSKQWPEETQDTHVMFDYSTDDSIHIPGNTLFWISVISFVWLRSFLLMHYIDWLAIVLAALLSSVAMFVSCRPIDRDTMCYRVTGITAFIFALIPIIGLALEHAAATEVYVLALCVLADGLLVVGHTWDFPACPLRTVMNCRVAYMMTIQVALPFAIAASCELF